MVTAQRMTRRGAVMTVLVLTTPAWAHAQTVSLGEPTGRIAEDFGSIQSVRELPDGRVVVADPLGKALYAVDLDRGTRTVVGTEGQGPDEYLQPDAVWPLPADSTLLVDLGNGRLVALGPDLTFGPTMPIGLSEPRPGSPLVLALPQGVDARGRIYARLMGGMAGQLPDSGEIARIDRETRGHEVVGRFKLPDRVRTTSGGRDNQNVQISQVPLSAEDIWGVAPDGSVVVARAGDYHVDWIRPDGSVVSGPPQDHRAVRIGTAEKEEWVTEQARGGGIQLGVEMVNGSVTMSFTRGGGASRPREIDNYQWPDRAPPFYQGRIPVDRDGRAWVRRFVGAGEPTTYDVFDRRGERVGTVRLGEDRRVLGFGRSSVYVVSFDDFDLAYLERYAMPSL